MVGIGVEKIHNFYLDNGLLSIIIIIISLGIVLAFLYGVYMFIKAIVGLTIEKFGIIKNKLFIIMNRFRQRIPKKWERLIIVVWVLYNFITFPFLGSRIWGLYEPLLNWITFQLLFIFILWGIVWAKEGFENNEQ